MRENLELWKLWRIIKNQWRVGFDGITGLDYTAVINAAKNMDIEITPCVMEKLEVLESYTLAQSRKKG